MMDKRLLDILCDPLTKSPVRPLSADELQALGRAVTAGKVSTEGGAPVKAPPAAGLITRDGRTIYRVDDDIPVMLPDEAIAVSQIDDFPHP
jgi:uncharacterized protein YbaR (Trm112 family)